MPSAAASWSRLRRPTVRSCVFVRVLIADFLLRARARVTSLVAVVAGGLRAGHVITLHRREAVPSAVTTSRVTTTSHIAGALPRGTSFVHCSNSRCWGRAAAPRTIGCSGCRHRCSRGGQGRDPRTPEVQRAADRDDPDAAVGRGRCRRRDCLLAVQVDRVGVAHVVRRREPGRRWVIRHGLGPAGGRPTSRPARTPVPTPASTKAPRAERKKKDPGAELGDRHWLGMRVIRMMEAPGSAPVGVGSVGPRTVAGAFSCPTHPLSGVRIPDVRRPNTPAKDCANRRTRTLCVLGSGDGSESLREALQSAPDHPPVPVVGKGVAAARPSSRWRRAAASSPSLR